MKEKGDIYRKREKVLAQGHSPSERALSQRKGTLLACLHWPLQGAPHKARKFEPHGLECINRAMRNRWPRHKGVGPAFARAKKVGF